MKTRPTYIFQCSLLTREVFIIYKYKEDLKYMNHEEILGIIIPLTRFLTREIYPLVSQKFRHHNGID